MKLERRRGRRVITGMIAGAMALSLTPFLAANPAAAADPLPPVANPIANGAVCQNAPTTNPFIDLGQESAATRLVILCLVSTGLTSGTTQNTYTPGGTVTRRQMALFIKRLADLSEALETGKVDFPNLPVYDNVPDYTDVAAEDPAFQEAIGQLSQAAIVGGFPDGTFRPGVPVTRRQMAAFINRLQNFLAGAPYSTDQNYFDDDDDDPGEDDLNALAFKGIFQGDGQGNVFPGADLSRRQMANILLRDAQVYFAEGFISAPFKPVAPTGSFPVTPGTVETLEQEQTRDFTASDLADDIVYDILLFKCGNVSGDAQSGFTFKAQGDSSPDNTKASTGAPAATVTVVNGEDAAPSKDGVTPAAGKIAFTIKGSATECVRPIVFADQSDDDTLDINPVSRRATEAFGVGGQTKFIPAESRGGVVAGFQVALIGSDYAVVESGTVYFTNRDSYWLISNSGPPAVLNQPAFFERLSTADRLYSCANTSPTPVPSFAPAPYTARTPTSQNTFCLEDGNPPNPTNLVASAGSPPDRAIDLNWTAASPADSYNIYRQRSTCEDATVGGLTKVGSVPATQTSFTASNLEGNAFYCFVVTTVEQGDESAVAVNSDRDQTQQENKTNNITQRKTQLAPTIQTATLTNNAGAAAATTGDIAVLVFSESMASSSLNQGTITVIDPDGDTARIRCGVGPTPINGDITGASCTLSDTTVENDTLTITLAENGDDGNGGGDGTVEWPLRITATESIRDADDNLDVNLPGSADLLINV